MSLADSWQSFLDACADKGLPFRDWAYALEDKGVPSLPVFALAIALIAGVLAFVVAPSLGAGIGPAKGSLKITVTDLAGGQIAGEPTVTITNSKTGTPLTSKAVGGVALFSDIAPGDYQVSVVSDTLVFTPALKLATVTGGKTATLNFEGQSAAADLVSLYVTIKGADSADIDVAYDSGVPVDSATAASHEFRVSKNRNYVVTASQKGYSPVSKTVLVGTQNEQVTLTLVKKGAAREASLHIGVFDEAGIAGNPIENASVRVIEAKTLKTLFTLRTAQDGSCDAAPVPFGASLSVVASAPGFEPKTQGVNATDEVVNVKIQLKRAAAAENTTIEVVSETGEAVAAPLIRVFDASGAVRLEAAPIDGVLQLNPEALGGFAGLSATVYKPGFIPQRLASIRRGSNRVKLSEATQQNSGSVRVLVTDKNGLPAPQANVNLLDSAKRQLGFPGGVTGEDGAFAFDGVPAAGGGVIAGASKAGRYAESALTQVPAGGEVEAQVRFAAAKARFEALVTDAVSRKPIAGATVKLNAGSSASCTTSGNGKCGFEVVESDAATAVVTAAGYEDFQSDEFALTPGAKNTREFALTPLAALAGKISFIGFFDENGKRASELKPLGFYTARFSLQGSESQRAVAHVRVGGEEKSLDEEPIQIVSYSASGGRVTRGASYDEAVALEEGLQGQTPTTTKTPAAGASDIVVGIYDYGFVPSDVLATEGGRVTFKNLGATPHTVVFDQGFEGGAGSSSNVLQPNQTFVVKPPRSGSWSFHCGLHPQETGTLNVVPATQQIQTQTAKASAGTLSGAEATAFKWVEFSFEPFKGRKEVSVRFKTRERVGEKAWLEYRAAFYGVGVGAGGAGAVVRQPEDAAAGVSKPEILADALKTPALAIKFGGICDNGVCLKYWFEQNGVRERADEAFTAELGKTFKLGFHVLKEIDGPVTLRLKIPTSAAAGGALALRQASLGTKIVAAPVAGEANASELAVVLRDADSDVEGSFQIEALRLSNDAELSLAALDSKRDTLLEESAFLRVAAQGTPSLRVSLKPRSLTALQEKTLVFAVANAFGTPISNCRATVEAEDESNEIIPAALEAEENSQAAAQRGEYKIAGVKPAGMGALKWRVTCEGYAPASGTIDVKAPTEAISVTPDAVKLALRDEGSTEAKIRVQNKVSNALRVTLSAEFYTNHKYAVVAVSPETLDLKGGESKEVTVTAELSPETPFVSSAGEKLSEKSSGAVHVTATTGDANGFGAHGTFGEMHDVLFQIDASVSQKKISDLWSLEPQAVALELQAPSTTGAGASAGETETEFASEEGAAKTVTIENRGDYSLVINQKTDLDGVTVDPLSTVLDPHESADFVVSAALPDDLPDCLAKDAGDEGTITFYASRLGASSQKTVALKKTIKASQYCEPQNAVSVTLPLSLTLEVPSGAQAKDNEDGSRTLMLSSGEMLWFDSGSSADSQSVTLPLNTRMKTEARRAAVTQSGVTLTLPVQAAIEIPDDADVAQQGAALVVSAGNALLYLPAGIALTVYQNKRSAVVPPNSPIRFERAPIYDILNMLPPGGISLNLPVEETLVLPTSARIIAPSGAQSNAPAFGYGGYGYGASSAYSGYAALSRFQNVNAVVLPDGLRIAFGGDARVERTPLAVIVTVPAKSQLVVPPLFVTPISQAGTSGGSARAQAQSQYGSSFGEVFDAFSLSMPFLSLPGIPKDARLIEDKKNSKYSYRLAEGSVVQFKFDPRPASTTSGGVTQVRVTPMQPVFFLSGASAEAVEDPTQVCGVPEVFVPDDDVIIDFPAGTTFKKGPVTATMRECSSDSKIRVYSAKNPDFVYYESPASKRVVVEGGKLEGDASDAEAQHVVKTSGGKQIKFSYCEKDNEGRKIGDELKQASIKIVGATTLTLPASAKLKGGLSEIQLGGYKKIKLTGLGGKSFEVGPTNKIEIEFGLGETDTAKQKEKIERGETDKLTLPPGSTIKYVPYCNKASSGSLEVKTGAAPLAFDPKALQFTLSNAQKSDTKEVCIKNLGLEIVKLNSLEVKPDAGSELMTDALPTDAEHMHFSDAKKYGGVQTGDIPSGEKCARYSFTAVAPADVLDEYGCIAADANTVLNGSVLLHTTNERGLEQEPVPLPATVTINGGDANERCEERKTAENMKNMFDAGIAELGPDQRGIYFKGVNGVDGDHKQFITLKNNWREDVTVRVVRDDGLANCEGFNSHAALNGVKLVSGTVALFVCTSVRAGRGSFVLNFSSDESKWAKEFPVEVVVYSPDAAVKNLYTHSPVGKVYIGPDTLKGLEGPGAPAQQASGGTASQAAASQARQASELPSCLSFDTTPPSSSPQSSSATPPDSATQPAAVTTFALCETRYCAGVDAVQKFDAFLDEVAKAAVAETKNDQQYEKIRARLGAHKDWQKVFVLHLTNTVYSAETLAKKMNDMANSRSKQLVAQGFKRGIVFDDKSVLKHLKEGCGIYAFYAKLDAGGGGGMASTVKYEDRVKDYALNVYAAPLVGCEETVANLPLLMSPDDVDFYSGNEIDGNGGSLASIGTWFSKRWLRGKQALVGVYYAEQNERDVKHAAAFSVALYGPELERGIKDGSIVGIKPCAYYEDLRQCWRNLNAAAWTIRVSWGVTFGVAALLGLKSLPVYDIRPLLALTTSLFSIYAMPCITDLAIHGANCGNLNFCTHMSMVALADGIANMIQAAFFAGPAVNWKQALSGAWKQMLINSVSYATVVGGLALLGEKKSDPTIVYFGGTLLRVTVGAIAARGGAAGGAAAGAAAAGAAAAPKGLREITFSDYSEASLGGSAATLFFAAKTAAAGGTTESAGGVQQAGGGGGENLVNAGNIATVAAPVGLVLLLGGGKAIGNAVSGAARGTGRLFSGFGGRALGTWGTPNILGGGLRGALPGMVGAGLVLALFQVQGKPVRAEFSNEFASHVLSLHYEGDFPTARQYCYLTDGGKKKDKYGSSVNCVQSKEIADQSKVCPVGLKAKACLLVVRSPGTDKVPNTPQEQGVKGYAALLVVQNDDLKTREVFESIFQPELPLVSEATGRNVLVSEVGDEVGYDPPTLSEAEANALNQQITGYHQQMQQTAKNAEARAKARQQQAAQQQAQGATAK